MVVTMIDGEIMERSVGMVPLRITVLVTLRELRPLAGKTQKHVRRGLRAAGQTPIHITRKRGKECWSC